MVEALAEEKPRRARMKTRLAEWGRGERGRPAAEVGPAVLLVVYETYKELWGRAEALRQLARERLGLGGKDDRELTAKQWDDLASREKTIANILSAARKRTAPGK